MNWKFALLGMGLLVFQTEATAPPPGRAGVVVEVGRVPMQGLWYQDGRDHVHDAEVRLRHVYRRPGLLRVNLGTGLEGSTDLEFNFSHDASGATGVGVSAQYRHDSQIEGSPATQRLKDLEGRVILQSNDWGPGKTITCLFVLRGRLEQERQQLLGSFLILIPQ